MSKQSEQKSGNAVVEEQQAETEQRTEQRAAVDEALKKEQHRVSVVEDYACLLYTSPSPRD